MIVYTFFYKIICKTCNTSAWHTVYSQFELTQINLPPHFAPHPHLPKSYNPPPTHYPTFIPTPTSNFTKAYPQTQAPSYHLPPPPVLLPQFVYHWTGQGGGLLSVNNTYIPPFSISTPSPKCFVPPSTPPPHFFYPAHVNGGGGGRTEEGWTGGGDERVVDWRGVYWRRG